MFRSIFDHPQGDIFSFTSVTKDKIIWFVVACLLYLLYFVLMLLRALPSLVVAVGITLFVSHVWGLKPLHTFHHTAHVLSNNFAFCSYVSAQSVSLLYVVIRPCILQKCRRYKKTVGEEKLKN